MSTKHLLRGHRARKARRFLKRHPESYVIGHWPTPQGKLGTIIFGPATFEKGFPRHVGKQAADELVAATEDLGLYEASPTIKTDDDIHVCETCGATGDDPCMTKSGKIAAKEHASRRSP